MSAFGIIGDMIIGKLTATTVRPPEVKPSGVSTASPLGLPKDKQRDIYAKALTLNGLKEANAIDRKKLAKLFKDAGPMELDPATTPWCAAFVNATCYLAGVKGSGSDMARSFLKWGVEVKRADVREGDIAVIERGGPNASTGHVTFFVKWNPGKESFIGFGGNQSDCVCYTTISAARLLGFRRIT